MSQIKEFTNQASDGEETGENAEDDSNPYRDGQESEYNHVRQLSRMAGPDRKR